MKWIFVTTPENAVVCFKYGVYGVSEEKYGFTAINHVSGGDHVFFYITRCRVFIGPCKVVNKPCRNPELPRCKGVENTL